MRDQDVIDRLPEGWRDLFLLLCKHHSPEAAGLWYMEAMQSSYGHRPNWHGLLLSLQIQDPFIINRKLLFKPRFLHLSEELQEMFLAFLVKESCIISDKDLVGFVRTLNRFRDIEKRTEISGERAHLLQQIVGYEEAEELETVEAEGECAQEAQLETERPDDNKPERTDDVVIIEEEEITEPAAKRLKLNLYEDADHVIENDDVEIEEDNRTDDNQETDDTMEFDGAERIREMIEKLKELWQGDEDSDCPAALSEVSRLSLHEIEWFCKRIGFDAMTDDSTELVCKHLCLLAESLSYTNAVCILKYVIRDKVMQLTQTPSRKLSGAITLVAETFPKQLIDSVLVPCVCQDEIPSFQGELTCRLIKDKFSAHSVAYLLLKLVSQDLTINESKLLVLQTLLENVRDMDHGVVSNLLDSLSQASDQLAKNLKFGKLLLALVNKHGTQLTGENNMNFSTIVDKHNTFLRKTIKNALNKLK